MHGQQNVTEIMKLIVTISAVERLFSVLKEKKLQLTSRAHSHRAGPLSADPH